MIRLVASIFFAAVAAIASTNAASAMTIEKIVSPAGIEAWLVREKSLPLVTLNYAFHGGATQDDADKAGTANLAADLLDEGAGDLDGKTFHERLENRAIELSFQVGRDYIYGSLRTLNEHRDEAFDLLRLSLTSPRFDADVGGRPLSPITPTVAKAKALSNPYRASLQLICASMCAACSRATN
jgi:zinc protease